MAASPTSPPPAREILAAGGWFDTFNNLVNHAQTLALAALGLVIVVTILTTMHMSKGGIAKVVMAGLTGAVAYWLATSYIPNSKRTENEINGAPAITVVSSSPQVVPLDGAVLSHASSRSGT
ncbi:hypothetical protein [Frankia sp. AgKG'84/4]|uniref:hypothetical protein n=1 Tax=Frankia sp. AgKG'84/4 TaxID=573490 RepID=UPI00200E592E|nr:hypothetical protein [Frankia sp. AgKG'84/4]MCL9793098.1 hypothetical protein [Frankia sp. AgKG'84/4]